MKYTVGTFTLIVMGILYASVGFGFSEDCLNAPQITVEVASPTSVKLNVEAPCALSGWWCSQADFFVVQVWKVGSSYPWREMWERTDPDFYCHSSVCGSFHVFIDGLVSGAAYQFRGYVGYHDSDCDIYDTEWSDWVVITVGPPSPPSLYAYPLGPDEVGIYWTDTSDNESGFRIQRQVAGQDFSTIATVPAGTTSYSDSGLSPNTTYCYRVVAYNAAGEAISNVYCVTTPNAPPAAPSELVARATTSEIYLTWQDNSENEEGFVIERSQGGGPFSEIARVGANVTSYVDTGLPSGVTFCYRVCAYNGEGN